MWPGHQNNIGDQNIISVPQRPYNVTLPPPLLRTYTGLQILTGPWQNPLFFSFSLIYRYIRLIYIWNIFFQNLQNLSFQKSIYVLRLSLTVKKLFKFEVMFRKGVHLFLFTSFLKNPLKNFHFLIFFQKVGGFSIMSLLQKMAFREGWKH